MIFIELLNIIVAIQILLLGFNLIIINLHQNEILEILIMHILSEIKNRFRNYLFKSLIIYKCLIYKILVALKSLIYFSYFLSESSNTIVS